MDEFVWSREIGEARVTVICEGGGWWPMERALEDVPAEQWRSWVNANDRNEIWVDFNLVHVRLPGASLLLDTGFGEYDPTDPEKPLVSVRDIRLTPGRDAGLASVGVSPDDVTHVLISHMHGDHILGATRVVDGRRVPSFPNARYLVMEAEWASAPEWHQRADAINAQKEALLASNRVELLTAEREVVPGVTFIPAPGESPGHAIVRLATREGVVYYLGDLFHQPAEFAHLDWIPRYRDREALIASRKKLLPRFVEESAWLIPAHHAFPAVGRVRQVGQGYRWTTDQS